MTSTSRIPPSASRNVLLVEDEPRLREMMARAVADMGFAVTPAGSGEAGIRALERAEPPADIVLLDLNLPGMGGLEFLKLSRDRWPELAVIVLTGFGDLEAARTAIHYNVVEFLSKPCPLGDLEAALDRARHRRAGSGGGGTGGGTVGGAGAAPVVAKASAPGSTASAERSLEDLEREHILATLDRLDGNRAAAADALGISVRKLYYRLEQYQRQGLIKADRHGGKHEPPPAVDDDRDDA